MNSKVLKYTVTINTLYEFIYLIKNSILYFQTLSMPSLEIQQQNMPLRANQQPSLVLPPIPTPQPMSPGIKTNSH